LSSTGFSKTQKATDETLAIPQNNQLLHYYDKETYQLADVVAVLSKVVSILSLAMFLLGILCNKVVGV
jgi:hypothetical protein